MPVVLSSMPNNLNLTEEVRVHGFLFLPTTGPVYYKKRSQCCSPMLKIDALIWKGLNMLCHWAFYCNQAPNTGIYVLVFVTVLIAIDFRPVRSKLRHTDTRFL